MTRISPAYPVNVEVNPPAGQGRLTILVRAILAIPHYIILYLLGFALAVVTFIAWLAILFTGRYPESMLRFVVSVFHWQTRVTGYIYFLTGQYPPFSTDPVETYPVRFRADVRPEGRNRLTTFFRLLLVIPHILVLIFVGIAAFVVLVIAWVAGLIAGRIPEGLHSFLAGVLRWITRVNAYSCLLVDRYPPFSLN